MTEINADAVGLSVPEVLLPGTGVDPAKWAVVACDQYTSEPEYWKNVESTVADAPSTLELIFPEVHLGKGDPDARIARIREAMRRYLDQGLLVGRRGIVYVERTIGERVRRGLVVALDLERYDFTKGSASLVRATEGTILDRLPPRIRIREGAPIELPHIMVLIDDPDDRVIGGVAAKKQSLEKLYDFELMMGGGHLSGRLLNDAGRLARVFSALDALRDPAKFAAKYGVELGTPELLYAMGDGNHSLATAKAIWDRVRTGAAPDDPRRFALVELVNVHDPALEFEPIHRVLFELEDGFDVHAELKRKFGERLSMTPVASLEQLTRDVKASTSTAQRFGVITAAGYRVATLSGSDQNLPVGSLQAFLDPIVSSKRAKEIDYVHGSKTVDTLGKKPNSAGFYLPPMNKHDLFRTVILDGALPRKTFSMGEAEEKRYYMECRRIAE